MYNPYLKMEVRIFYLIIVVFSFAIGAVSKEISLVSATGQIKLEVDTQNFDNLTYVHLPTILMKINTQISFSDSKINITKDNIQVDMELSSTIYTVVDSNITKMFQLSYPLKVFNDTIWIEFGDLNNLAKNVFGYQIVLEELKTQRTFELNEFEDISIPTSPPSEQSSGNKSSEEVSLKEGNKKFCWKRILVIPGHFYSEGGIKYSNKLSEKDINKQLSSKIADILNRLGLEVKVASEIRNANLEQVREYLTKENPDLLISVHLSYPSQDKFLLNIFCSKFNDAVIDQVLIDFTNKLLENSRKNPDLLLKKVYLCPLMLSSISGIPELLIEFIPDEVPDSKEVFEDIQEYKFLINVIGNSIKEFSAEKCK